MAKSKNINFQNEGNIAKALEKMGLIPFYYGLEARNLIPANKRQKLFVQKWILVNNVSPEGEQGNPYSANFRVINKIIKPLKPRPDQEEGYQIAVNTMVQHLGSEDGYNSMKAKWQDLGYNIKHLYQMSTLSSANIQYVKQRRECMKKVEDYQKKLKQEVKKILKGFTTPTSHLLLLGLHDWLFTTKEGIDFHITAYRKVF